MFSSRKQATSYQDKVVAELEAAPNISSFHWAKWEEDILKKYYGKKDTALIARLINRKHSAVVHKIQRLRMEEGICDKDFRQLQKSKPTVKAGNSRS